MIVHSWHTTLGLMVNLIFVCGFGVTCALDIVIPYCEMSLLELVPLAVEARFCPVARSTSLESEVANTEHLRGINEDFSFVSEIYDLAVFR